MTQENKELLLKDLCARLPYGVICEDRYGNVLELIGIDNPNTATFKCSDKTFWGTDLDKCKLYLFPLSSMTEKQKEEYEDALVSHDYVNGGWTMAKTFDDEYVVPYWFVDFCNKNHLDYRGLIPMGLAIDATGKNIY